MDKALLAKAEPQVYQLFLRSREQNRIANAYLLYGPRNAPLKETALYLAKSLSCTKDVFACNACSDCLRFQAGIRPDFVLIDGETETIKKDDITALENGFAYSALEKGHRLAYVINRIENITEEASNTLLKFLEEPREGQVAFLTTYNLPAVLKTIVSRSVTVRVDPVDPKGFRSALRKMTFQGDNGKEKFTLSEGEAYILSRLYSDPEEVTALLQTDSSFRDGYAAAEAFLNDFAVDVKEASFTLLRQNSLIKDNACYNWMYLTLSLVFQDALSVGSDNEESPFADILPALAKDREALHHGLLVVEKALAYKQVNFSPTLISSQLIVALTHEEKSQ